MMPTDIETEVIGPTPQNSVVVLRFPYEKYSVEEMRNFHDDCAEKFAPTPVVTLPNDVDLSVMSRTALAQFKENMIRCIDFILCQEEV